MVERRVGDPGAEELSADLRSRRACHPGRGTAPAAVEGRGDRGPVAQSSGGEGQLAAAGFCIGGQLAFRAALNRDVRATVCFYATGLHTGKLGQDVDAGSLARASEIQGELMLVFGTRDPHVPDEGRKQIDRALAEAGVRYSIALYPAEQPLCVTGPRYDPEATDHAFAGMIAFFRRVMT